MLFLRGDRSDRPALGLVSVGFACCAASDFAYAAGLPAGLQLGSILDLGWIAGYALIALAIRNPGSGAVEPDQRPVESSPVVGTAFTFTLFLGAAVLSLYRQPRPPQRLRRGLWVLVLLAVLARQILLVVDNERLRRILERRVIERSSSLLQVDPADRPAGELRSATASTASTATG